MAAAVAAFGILTSKGRAFSAATRVSRTRTASETERPIAARVFEARSSTRRSMRTWTIPVVVLRMRYINIAGNASLSPLWGWLDLPALTQGLRRGLQSCAASRLTTSVGMTEPEICAGSEEKPALSQRTREGRGTRRGRCEFQVYLRASEREVLRLRSCAQDRHGC